jgi:fibronectin type 3 domain-containing protein
LTWQAPTGADGFQIARQLGSDAPISIATLPASATSFNDSGLLEDSAYQYTVVAFNSAGTGPGATVSVQTSITAPATPSGLTATPGDQSITLSWSASSGATGYNVYRGTTAGGESMTPLAAGITTTRFVDTGADAGTTYFYVVTAMNGAGPSSPSSEVSATVSKPQPGPQSSIIVPTIAGKLPASAIAGHRLNVNLTVTLTNSAASPLDGTANGAFYLSAGTTVDASSIALPAAFAKKLKLKPHQKFPLHLKLGSVPASVGSGTYHLLFQVTDSTGAKNTVNAGTITIAPPEIDLTAVFSKVPLSETIGRKQTVTITVTNKGTTAASGLLPILLDASPSGALNGGAVRVLAANRKINLRPGKPVKITLNFIAGAAIPTNSYLIGQLDPANTFGDVNTANDTFVTSQRITVI